MTSKSAHIAVQWIPAHCDVAGNERADKLAKSGSKMEQTNHPVSYREAKTLVKRKFQNNFQQDHNYPSDDQVPHLQRSQQTTIFRLRTGHCRLRAHLYRLGLSHTPDCPCETGPHTPEHILQSCPLHQETRMQLWPNGATLEEKLWSPKSELNRTTDVMSSIGLEV